MATYAYLVQSYIPKTLEKYKQNDANYLVKVSSRNEVQLLAELELQIRANERHCGIDLYYVTPYVGPR